MGSSRTTGWSSGRINCKKRGKGSLQKKNTGLFGNFSQHGGGSSQFPKLKTKKKVPLNHPKNKLNFSQNHPKNFILNEAFPKGGGGPDVWEKFPKIPYFFVHASLCILIEQIQAED